MFSRCWMPMLIGYAHVFACRMRLFRRYERRCVCDYIIGFGRVAHFVGSTYVIKFGRISHFLKSGRYLIGFGEISHFPHGADQLTGFGRLVHFHRTRARSTEKHKETRPEKQAGGPMGNGPSGFPPDVRKLETIFQTPRSI